MHDVRIAYLVSDEGVIDERTFLEGGGCPITGARAPAEVKCPPIRFGRMFKERDGFPPDLKNEKIRDALMGVAQCLIDLGKCMDNPECCHGEKPGKQGVSAIPAGYTYLGQFITHEITFHKTAALSLSEAKPENARSPSLDLDSLYGEGPGVNSKSRELYVDGPHPARLKVGWTQPPPAPLTDSSQRSSRFPEFQNDLPRRARSREREGGVAIIGDERNDENLPLAQTHVAFLRFHNRVVDDLKGGRYKDYARPADEGLFEKARAEVIRHFQWIVLKDYLPRIVGEDLVKSLTRKPSSDKFKKFKGEEDLFIPLEFSAAAFRIGHSMVRRIYMWSRLQGDVKLFQLFTHTKLSGNLGNFDRLNSTWVIDWKQFYDFTPFAGEYPPPYDPPQEFNRAGKLDTTFDFRLETIPGFQHLPQPEAKNDAGEKPDDKKSANPIFNGEKALTVRNLLRGLSLGLPWAEDVAKALVDEKLLKEDECLKPAELREGQDAKLLDALGGKTPLWFYILKEAKVKEEGERLGPVGGRIVAETLIGLIRHSKYSILRRVEGTESEWELSGWRPAYGRHSDVPEGVKFEMVDLLRAADVVDPLGKYLYQLEHP